MASLVDNDAGSKVVGFLLIAEGALAIKTPRPRTANSAVGAFIVFTPYVAKPVPQENKIIFSEFPSVKIA